MILAALRAAVAPALLCALEEAGLDVAVALDGRGRDFDGLGVVEGRLTSFGQSPRVALGAGTDGPAVTLVADDVPGGRGGQRRCAVGAGQGEHTAGEGLLEDGVAAVLRLDVVDFGLQRLAVADHGSHAQPAELPRVVDRWVDVEDAAGVLVDNIADDVQLELRLDNVLFRLGFARTRKEARQIVDHKHVLVNGKCVNIPSYLVKAGDVIEIREKSKSSARYKEILESTNGRLVPEWLEADADALKGSVKSIPTREVIDVPVNEMLIVELYSK